MPKLNIDSDFVIIHFNNANRTIDEETTDATAIHPISERCEEFLTRYCITKGITSQNGVILLNKHGSTVIEDLNLVGFSEHTFFVDDIYKAMVSKQFAA